MSRAILKLQMSVVRQRRTTFIKEKFKVIYRKRFKFGIYSYFITQAISKKKKRGNFITYETKLIFFKTEIGLKTIFNS